MSRTGFSGELGYELFVFGGAEAAGPVWDAVIARGATPMGLDAVEMLRVESGFVVADEDYVTGTTDPVDLSLERFIDLDARTEFIGRDAVSRRLASPARRFVTLSIEGDEAVPVDPVIVVDGDPVGEVRSVQRTPRFGLIALAVVDEAFAVDGTAGADRRGAPSRPRCGRARSTMGIEPVGRGPSRA